MSVNWTNLSQAVIVPGDQLTCWMNNQGAANQHVFPLDGTNVDFIGPGTVIGWQTGNNQGGLCSGSAMDQYSVVLNNGLTAGAQYLEVEVPAAQLPACNAALTSALTAITAIAGVTHCNWPMAQQAAIRH